ncbi:triacylglycerol lipase [Nocardioides sp. R-C-SC26]|uniref:esterase/lipase family protein n=1 Tax=Nocardioides sp. R-C-SC26 TaxID=2870414 RepID=UPI001E4E10F9|nr:hypothetical protein [Nocardioides sp. R-C-SC26]
MLVVNGTFGSRSGLDDLASWLRARGLDVSTMALDGLLLPGTAPIATSAATIATHVEEIQERTGADQVMLLGYSQGALAMRHYIKYGGGLDVVRVAVSLGGPHYGDNTAYVCAMFAACRDMLFGSAFLRHLNDGDDTPGDLDWVHLYSTDETWGAIPLDGALNLAVQERCPGREVSHLDELDDAAMRDLVLSAFREQPLQTTCPDYN